MLILLTIFWFVQFTDKLGSAPITFSDRATENRKNWNIKTDSLDYAVVPQYVDSVRGKGARVCYVSRWMNGCAVEADSTEAMAIKTLPFVKAIEQTRNDKKGSSAAARKLMLASSVTDPYQSNGKQLDVYNLRGLHEIGYEGQGRLIAVIDAGFYHVDKAPCFDSVRNRIKGLYDFSEDTTTLFTSHQHGANCFSFIAAQTATYHGAATQAEYILIRTEENDAESPKECDNLVAAYELCDSLGVNIITCSLGYRLFDDQQFDYTYDMLDGRTTRASRAAAIAARKGMLLCQSAGNDGTYKPWYKISVPSDADSILTVGALSVDSVMASFSSYGPSADGRVKPEVSAVGVDAVYWSTSTNRAEKGNGTSYSTPLVAGLAACLWSALPEATSQEIRQRIIESAHLYPNHDNKNQMGYGIPDAWKAYNASPTVLHEVQNAECTMQNAHKVIYNGRLYILREGKVYDAQGGEGIERFAN